MSWERLPNGADTSHPAVSFLSCRGLSRIAAGNLIERESMMGKSSATPGAATLTQDAMMLFAERWISAWNRRDADAVLSHFDAHAIFISPVARRMGYPTEICGRDALAAYWHAALQNLTTIEFKLDHASWGPARRELTVIYEANLNGNRTRSCEVMRFNPEGRQIHGEAFYGAPL